MPLVLDRLVEFQQSADELKSYLVSSLIYPGLLSVVGAGSVFILLNFVIPKFADVFGCRPVTPAPDSNSVEHQRVFEVVLVGIAIGSGWGCIFVLQVGCHRAGPLALG